MAPVDRFVLPRQAVTGAAPSIWWHDVKAGLEKEKVAVLVVGRGLPQCQDLLPPNSFELSGAGRLTNCLNENVREPPDGVRFGEVLRDAFT